MSASAIEGLLRWHSVVLSQIKDGGEAEAIGSGEASEQAAAGSGEALRTAVVGSFWVEILAVAFR